MKYFGIVFLLILACSSCKKIEENRIIGTWRFETPPDENWTSRYGESYRRNHFCGDETISFERDYSFELNHEEVGTWSYNRGSKTIKVAIPNRVEGCDYPIGGFTWEVEELKRKKLKVYAPYYRFQNNYYSFEKD